MNPCNLAQSKKVGRRLGGKAYRSAWAAWQRWADVADYLEARHAGGASPATICVVRAAATFPWDHNEARREAPGSLASHRRCTSVTSFNEARREAPGSRESPGLGTRGTSFNEARREAPGSPGASRYAIRRQGVASARCNT